MKLTETDLHRIIGECVKNVLNELSTDTIDSAREKAEGEYRQAKSRFADNDPRVLKKGGQWKKFEKAWDDEYRNGNNNRKAKMLDNREKRKNGQRSYVSGKGWRNNA